MAAENVMSTDQDVVVLTTEQDIVVLAADDGVVTTGSENNIFEVGTEITIFSNTICIEAVNFASVDGEEVVVDEEWIVVWVGERLHPGNPHRLQLCGCWDRLWRGRRR